MVKLRHPSHFHQTVLLGHMINNRHRIYEQKNSKVYNGLNQYVKETEVLPHVPDVNGWEPVIQKFLTGS